MKRLLGFILCFLLLASCVNREEFQRLQYQVANQRQSINKLENELSSSKAQLSEEMTDVRPTQADQWAEIRNLQTSVSGLQGRVDDLERRAAQLAQTQTANTKELDSLRANMDRAETLINQAASMLDLNDQPPPRNVAAASSGSGSGTGAASSDSATSASADDGAREAAGGTSGSSPAEALYNQALKDFRNREYKTAQTTWEEFVKTFPNHSLVPNALFWQGESFYQMEDYARAALAYQDVISKHQNSNKYPAALLKQGISLVRLGKTKAGKLLLQDVIDKYPNTAEARRAKSELAALH